MLRLSPFLICYETFQIQRLGLDLSLIVSFIRTFQKVDLYSRCFDRSRLYYHEEGNAEYKPIAQRAVWRTLYESENNEIAMVCSCQVTWLNRLTKGD